MSPQARKMTPSQRISADLCPECGEPLAERSAEAHAMDHWPSRNVERGLMGPEGTARRRMLLDYANAKAGGLAHSPRPDHPGL